MIHFSKSSYGQDSKTDLLAAHPSQTLRTKLHNKQGHYIQTTKKSSI